MRLAVITPLAAQATGVVDYSLDLLPHLARASQAIQFNHLATYVRAFGFGHGTEGTALARCYLQRPMEISYPHYLVSEWLKPS
jgi:hypothetical protein